MKLYDLLVCIRCHRAPSEVLDTLNCIEWSCDPQTTCVVIAVDGMPSVYRQLKFLGEKRVFISSRRWRWGVGLFSLLVESFFFFSRQYNFSHFLSVDFDVLFTSKRVDQRLLSLITSPSVGLVGRHKKCDITWVNPYLNSKARLEELFGPTPLTYRPGEAVQGGCMLLTRAFIDEMKARNMLVNFLGSRTRLSDDHLLPLFCRMCGLDIVNARGIINCAWKRQDDPRQKKPSPVIHVDWRSKGYASIRQYLREIRDKTDGTPETKIFQSKVG